MYLTIVEYGAAIALLTYPSAMISIAGGMNGVFALLLLLSIVALAFRPFSMPTVAWDKEAVAFLVAMAALPVAIFLNQSYFQNYIAHVYDAPSRFLLAVPIFILLRRIRPSVVAIIQYGFPLGAIVALVTGDASGARMRTPFLDPIHFGDFALVLGVMSLVSLDWLGRDALALRVLKIAGFLAGAYATLLSATLGAWAAIPVLLAILIYFKVLKFSRKQVVLILLTLITATVLAYQFSEKIRSRVNQPLNDEITFFKGNVDTDVGVRLQLYKAAVLLVARHPIFGVGPEGFREQMTPMQQSGVITAIAANAGRGEVHNEILSRTVGLGIFGLVAIMLIYFVPLTLFMRKARSGNGPARLAGIMGVAFVGGFFVFGLSLDVLNLTMASAFYSFTVAVLLAACYNIHYREPTHQQMAEQHV